MAKPSGSARSSNGNEVKLAVLIGLGAFVFLLSAWGLNRLMQPSAPERPIPAWLGVSQVTAQTSDGRMLSVKVNLMLKNKDDLEVLAPYEPVFKSIVAETGQSLSSEETTGSERIVQFGKTVRESVNDYLEEQNVEPRVKRVAFEEFKLMP
jgi:flagellar basal body-associated protein FliL